MMRTALVRRTRDNALTIMRDDFYTSQEEMAKELRCNGFKVLKIWNDNVSDEDVEFWDECNRRK